LELLRPLHLGLLAEAYEKVDRFDEALTALGEALAASDEHESDAHEAEIRRLKGELLLRHGDSNVTEAKTCFERAIKVARRQSAKSLELRATTSLARQSSNRYRRRSQHIPVNRLCPSIGCERPWNTHFYENDLQRDG
jgi:tetratricopeptide (TPR) repeat protein